MKNTLILLSLTAFFACSKKESKEVAQPEVKTETVAQNCIYSYSDSLTSFNWKAYKTSEKIGVGGTFDEITVSSKSSNSIKSVLESISFEINTESVNSANDDRDWKIFAFFFSKMVSTDKIIGKVKSIVGDDALGSATFEITMNETTQDVNLTYNTTDGVVNFSGAFNLDKFNGQDAVASLNKKCEALHTGADGVSVLWPQVSLEISTQFSATCD
jgi:hypothetical protein